MTGWIEEKQEEGGVSLMAKRLSPKNKRTVIPNESRLVGGNEESQACLPAGLR